MSDKKYILTEQTIVYWGHTLHRIQAVKDFGNVHEGDFGGWVESEENLDQHSTCWIYDNAEVYDKACIKDAAKISNNARVHDYAIIRDYARITAPAVIFGNAVVEHSVRIFTPCQIRGDTRLSNSQTIKEIVQFSHTPRDYVAVGPIGSRNDTMTVYMTDDDVIYVETGCFAGTATEFVRAVCKTHLLYHPNIYREYMSALKAAKINLKRRAKM